MPRFLYAGQTLDLDFVLRAARRFANPRATLRERVSILANYKTVRSIDPFLYAYLREMIRMYLHANQLRRLVATLQQNERRYFDLRTLIHLAFNQYDN